MDKKELSERDRSSAPPCSNLARASPCQAESPRSILEFVIRRAHPGAPVTAERDFLEGFLISEDDGGCRQIIFNSWTKEATAECDTPWGVFFIQAKKPGGFEWTVMKRDEPPTYVKIRPGSYVQFALPGVANLLFRNRTGLGAHRYRHSDPIGRIEIRTETSSMIPFNPFPRERMKQWRIVISGERTLDCAKVLPPLASFLCYYKIYRRGYSGFYDTMF